MNKEKNQLNNYCENELFYVDAIKIKISQVTEFVRKLMHFEILSLTHFLVNDHIQLYCRNTIFYDSVKTKYHFGFIFSLTFDNSYFIFGSLNIFNVDVRILST